MQTFLPFKDYTDSATCLDNRRLGKQLIEVHQIFKALVLEKYGWKNHPAVKMWKDHEGSLLEYGHACYEEWKKRFGKQHKSGENIEYLLATESLSSRFNPPPWLGDELFHRTHRSNLLRKDKAHYSKYFEEVDSLAYFWPV